MQLEVVGVEERLPTLAGKRVGFAGRLLSCDRERASELVRRAGGTVGRRSVDVLVVAGGKPATQRSGAQTISEGDFLRLISAHGVGNVGDESVRELVSAQQAMRLYPRMTWARRRTLARHGLLQPVTFANGVGYRFRDLRTLREADEMIAACERTHARVAVAHQTHYSPRVEAVQRLIKEGKIGRVLEFRGRGKEDRRGGGEDLWVLGSHVMDLIRLFGGQPRWCFASVMHGGKPVTAADVVEGPEGIGPLAGDAVQSIYLMPDGSTAYFGSQRRMYSMLSRASRSMPGV